MRIQQLIDQTLRSARRFGPIGTIDGLPTLVFNDDQLKNRSIFDQILLDAAIHELTDALNSLDPSAECNSENIKPLLDFFERYRKYTEGTDLVCFLSPQLPINLLLVGLAKTIRPYTDYSSYYDVLFQPLDRSGVYIYGDELDASADLREFIVSTDQPPLLIPIVDCLTNGANEGVYRHGYIAGAGVRRPPVLNPVDVNVLIHHSKATQAYYEAQQANIEAQMNDCSAYGYLRRLSDGLKGGGAHEKERAQQRLREAKRAGGEDATITVTMGNGDVHTVKTGAELNELFGDGKNLSGEELIAGGLANIAIANFSIFFEQLTTEEKEKILNLQGSKTLYHGYVKNADFRKVWNNLAIQRDVLTGGRVQAVQYCVEINAGDIDIIVECNTNELKAFIPNFVKNTVLSDLGKQIDITRIALEEAIKKDSYEITASYGVEGQIRLQRQMLISPHFAECALKRVDQDSFVPFLLTLDKQGVEKILSRISADDLVEMIGEGYDALIAFFNSLEEKAKILLVIQKLKSGYLQQIMEDLATLIDLVDHINANNTSEQEQADAKKVLDEFISIFDAEKLKTLILTRAALNKVLEKLDDENALTLLNLLGRSYLEKLTSGFHGLLALVNSCKQEKVKTHILSLLSNQHLEKIPDKQLITFIQVFSSAEDQLRLFTLYKDRLKKQISNTEVFYQVFDKLPNEDQKIVFLETLGTSFIIDFTNHFSPFITRINLFTEDNRKKALRTIFGRIKQINEMPVGRLTCVLRGLPNAASKMEFIVKILDKNYLISLIEQDPNNLIVISNLSDSPAEMAAYLLALVRRQQAILTPNIIKYCLDTCSRDEKATFLKVEQDVIFSRLNQGTLSLSDILPKLSDDNERVLFLQEYQQANGVEQVYPDEQALHAIANSFQCGASVQLIIEELISKQHLTKIIQNDDALIRLLTLVQEKYPSAPPSCSRLSAQIIGHIDNKEIFKAITNQAQLAAKLVEAPIFVRYHLLMAFLATLEENGKLNFFQTMETIVVFAKMLHPADVDKFLSSISQTISASPAWLNQQITNVNELSDKLLSITEGAQHPEFLACFGVDLGREFIKSLVPSWDVLVQLFPRPDNSEIYNKNKNLLRLLSCHFTPQLLQIKDEDDANQKLMRLFFRTGCSADILALPGLKLLIDRMSTRTFITSILLQVKDDFSSVKYILQNQLDSTLVKSHFSEVAQPILFTQSYADCHIRQDIVLTIFDISGSRHITSKILANDLSLAIKLIRHCLPASKDNLAETMIATNRAFIAQFLKSLSPHFVTLMKSPASNGVSLVSVVNDAQTLTQCLSTLEKEEERLALLENIAAGCQSPFITIKTLDELNQFLQTVPANTPRVQLLKIIDISSLSNIIDNLLKDIKDQPARIRALNSFYIRHREYLDNLDYLFIAKLQSHLLISNNPSSTKLTGYLRQFKAVSSSQASSNTAAENLLKFFMATKQQRLDNNYFENVKATASSSEVVGCVVARYAILRDKQAKPGLLGINFKNIPKLSDHYGPDYHCLFAYSFIGEHGVGMQSIAERFCDNVFRNHLYDCMGVEFKIGRFTTPEDAVIKLQLWFDIKVDFRFRVEEQKREAIRKALRGKKLAILVFDVTKHESFNKVKDYAQMIKELYPDLLITLIANKIDLSASRVIDDREAKQWANENSIRYLGGVSARTGENVQQAIQSATYYVMENNIEAILNDLQQPNPNLAVPASTNTSQFLNLGSRLRRS